MKQTIVKRKAFLVFVFCTFVVTNSCYKVKMLFFYELIELPAIEDDHGAVHLEDDVGVYKKNEFGEWDFVMYLRELVALNIVDLPADRNTFTLPFDLSTYATQRRGM